MYKKNEKFLRTESSKNSLKPTTFSESSKAVSQSAPSPDNIIMSDSHTLIKKVINDEFLPASVLSDDGKPIDGFYEQVPGYTIYKLFIGDFDDDSVHGLNRIIHELQESGPNDVLECHISGYGGKTTEGITLFNVINTRFKNRSESYLNFGYSMNALAFMMTKERIVYEHSELMLHAWSGGYIGKANEITTRVKHVDKFLKNFFIKMLKDYFTKEELDDIIKGNDHWLDAPQMLHRGIATGIIIDGEYFTKEEYFEKYTKKGKIKKSWLKKQEESTEDTETDDISEIDERPKEQEQDQE